MGAGLFLGIVVGEWLHFLPRPWSVLAQTWTPWIVVPFFGGYLFRSVAGSVFAGIAVIAIGVLSYVTYKAIAYGAFSNQALAAEVPYLIAFGLIAGVIAGGAGALARDERPWLRAVGWGIPAAAAVAEAVAIVAGIVEAGVSVAFAIGIVAALVLVAGWSNASPPRLIASTTLLAACGLVVAVVDRSPLY